MTPRSPGPAANVPPTYASLLADEFRSMVAARRAARFPNALFIKIPKSAGTSAFQMLREHGLVKLKATRGIRLWFRNSGRVCFDHMSVGSLVDLGLVDREFVDSAFKFTIVRNPYDRARSLYRYLAEHPYLHWHRWPSFTEFLEILAAGHYEKIGAYNLRGLSQANPQVSWIRDVAPDKIYRFEELDYFVRDIEERWGVSGLNIPHVNRSVGPEPKLESRSKRLIEQVYAEDFERFGYEKL